MWQNILVFVLVILAVGFLVRRFWKSARAGGQASCGCGCGGPKVQNTLPDLRSQKH